MFIKSLLECSLVLDKLSTTMNCCIVVCEGLIDINQQQKYYIDEINKKTNE